MQVRERSGRLALLAALLAGAGAALIGLIRRRSRHPERGLPGVQPQDIEAGHELSDANVGAIVAVGIGLAVLLGIVLVLLTAFQGLYIGRPLSLTELPGLQPLATPQLPPEPRLESVPAESLREYRAREEQRLNSYGWVDQRAGIVHIPIERALELTLQRGLPTRAEGEGQQFLDRADGEPSDSSSGRAQERRR